MGAVNSRADVPMSRGEQVARRPPPMSDIVTVEDLRKVYASGFEALKGVSLSIREGELLALLGPNGAGKTTLISAICGLVTPSGGRVAIGGHDIQTDYRRARALVGLVPQDISLEPFERVINTVRFSRGLFGKPRDDAHLERVLKQLSLWDKRDSKVVELSGGMKRRVLIAKALSHEPRVLFLDEPTAGVDVELRKGMWETMRQLKAEGVTIILTTHYIEEAEAMADRIGVIDKGRILLVEDKAALMTRMGRKQMTIELHQAITAVPPSLSRHGLEIADEGRTLVYTYDTKGERTGITRFSPTSRRRGSCCATCRPGRARSRTSSWASGGRAMNWQAIRAIYVFEMSRTFRTLLQSVVSPVVSTSLYFVVFGAAIGSRIQEVDGVSYGAFIVPGLIMLSVMMQAVSNASFGIYFPKFIGTIFELLSAPVNFIEIVIGYVGAAATKSLIIGLIILATSFLFVDLRIQHPIIMLGFLVLTCLSFSLLGFIIGIWARNFEQLQLVPLLVVTPLVFLGGSFYSITMLPPVWQTITLFNPVVYLVSGFRWSFFGLSDVPVGLSLLAILGFTGLCLAAIWWIFRTGWRLRA
jgi:ABC-2 type transport system permease protein